jgi:hypothetical protein
MGESMYRVDAASEWMQPVARSERIAAEAAREADPRLLRKFDRVKRWSIRWPGTGQTKLGHAFSCVTRFDCLSTIYCCCNIFLEVGSQIVSN